MNYKNASRIAIIALIALLVTSIGALAGWYVVLRSKGQTLTFQNAARGFGFATPEADQNGSNYSNINGGGSFAVGATMPGNTTAGGDSQNSSGASANTAGSTSGTPENTTLPINNALNSRSSVKTPQLWHATKTPVAGFGFATGTPVVFFAERATGYLFKADLLSGELLRRTNTLFPKTYEAYISRLGGVLYRSVRDATGAVETFSGLPASATSTSVGTLAGVNLENNILALDANPDTNSIFYVAAHEGKFFGYQMEWIDGKSANATEIFSSTIASWKPLVLSDGRFVIVEKPDDGVSGYAYEITKSGDWKPLVRAAPGLTVLPLSGSNALLFGTSANSVLSLFAQTGTTTLALPIKTIAEKCVWAPYSPKSKSAPASDMIAYCAVPESISVKNFLRAWYMGTTHTSDAWWKINLTSGKTEKIISAGSAGTVDVVDPIIDPAGKFLAFKNGVDDSLWVLRISK